MKRMLFFLLLFLTGCFVPVKTERGPSLPPRALADPPQATNYQNDLFSIETDSGITLYENERPLANGRTVPRPDSIALLTDTYLLTISTFQVDESQWLTDIVEYHKPCPDLGPGRPMRVGNLPAMIYSDAPCGLPGSAYLFATHEQTGFRFIIEAAEPFPTVENEIRPLLDSFHAVGSLSQKQIGDSK